MQRTITFDDEEWQLVPRKPTPEMLGNAMRCTASWLNLSGSGMTVNYKKMSIRYRAMLAAAPCPYPLKSNWDQEFELALAERAAIYRDQLPGSSLAHTRPIADLGGRKYGPRPEARGEGKPRT